jgi:hypothetical protein
VAKTASLLSEHLQNPSPDHILAAIHCIGYLYNTRFYAIKYDGEVPSGQDVFVASSDAAFSDDPNTRFSSDGYLMQLYRGPIDWKASKQRTVTLSTTEAELLSVSHAGKEIMWWKRFFESIRFDPQQDLFIYCDNQQTVDLMQKATPRINTRLRHVDIHQCWLRQQVQNHKFSIKWLPGSKMPADGLTKRLPGQQHLHFINQLGLVDATPLIRPSIRGIDLDNADERVL